MELIIGATSRIAREYVNYISGRNIESVLVSRSGTDDIFPDNPQVKGHVVQDLTKKYWGDLESALNDKDISRVLYFAAGNTGNEDSENFYAVNSNPLVRILDLIDLRNLPFVYMSSDMVFGNRTSPAKEDEVPLNPWGDYGKSKVEGEDLTFMYDHGFIVRSGNVLGIKKDFLCSIVKNLKDGKECTAWDNVYNRFSSIDEVCLVLNKLRDYSGDQRIFHVASDDRPLSRYDLALKFAYICQNKEILPLGSAEKIKPVQHDFKDGRPQTLALNTETTSKELGFKPKPIISSLIDLIENRGSPYLD